MISVVRGMRDLLPPATGLWNATDQAARDLFRLYNYQEIRTPLVEETQLFARGVGEETDIVNKEMYTFADRDGGSLSLRPEATASVMRAYLEHRLDQQPGIHKLYYIGPMFRRERPQKGRYRQFYQIGIEAIGSESPAVDAEVVEIAMVLFRRLGMRDMALFLNSVGCRQCRPQYVELLRSELGKVSSRLCADCQRRAETNPLRVLDCKVEADQPVIDRLPMITDHLCPECREHFERVQSYLRQRGIAYAVRPRLVRGLDYYMRTTFEVTVTSLGAQNAVLGGGRYDGLAELLGAKISAPGIGFSIGEDRLVMTLEHLKSRLGEHKIDLFLAPLGEPEFERCAALAADLRAAGKIVELPPPGKLKRILEAANKLGARYALIVGESELAADSYTLKNMATGEQTKISRAGLAALN